MIRIGIIGGSDPMAGELLRLLINHPDVNIEWVNSSRMAGRLVTDVHHGMEGETYLRFSPTADLDCINLLFIFRHKGQTIEWLTDRMLPDDMCIIDLSVDMQDPDLAEEYGFVYGLPELNRKALVRGAKRAIVPHPLATLAALSLMPVAKEEMVTGDVAIDVTVPVLGEEPELEHEEIIRETVNALRDLQPSMTDNFTISLTGDTNRRALAITLSTAVTADVGTLTRLFEEYYSDHSFVHVINSRPPEARDVEGTNKCLLHIDKKDGRLVVTAVMDRLIKGGAGTAVHDMNLLFGLAERTGLALKASRYL